MTKKKNKRKYVKKTRKNPNYKVDIKKEKETADFTFQIGGIAMGSSDTLSVVCKIPSRILRRMK
jgi:hypothetical protein